MDTTAVGDSLFTFPPLTPADSDLNCGVDSPEDSVALTIQLSGILVLATLCIFGNSIVIYVMVKDKTLNSPLNYFITSLAVSDLIQGIIYAIYNISHVNVDIIRHTLGHWSICCPLLLMVLVTLASSAFNLVGIMVIRYMSVRWPLQHKQILTRQRVLKAIGLVWSLAFIFGVTFYVRPRPDKYCGVCRSELHWEFYQLFAMLIIPATIPFIVMISLYCSMAKTYIQHVKNMDAHRTTKSNSTTSAMSKSQQHERTLSRVSAFLVAYFFFSYMPFVVFTLTHKLCKCHVSSYWRSSVRIILFSNTTVNFFAYIFAHQDFRHAVIKIFCRKTYLARKRSLTMQGSTLSLKDSDTQDTKVNQGMTASVSTITFSVMDTSACTTLA